MGSLRGELVVYFVFCFSRINNINLLHSPCQKLLSTHEIYWAVYKSETRRNRSLAVGFTPLSQTGFKSPPDWLLDIALISTSRFSNHRERHGITIINRISYQFIDDNFTHINQTLTATFFSRLDAEFHSMLDLISKVTGPDIWRKVDVIREARSIQVSYK